MKSATRSNMRPPRTPLANNFATQSATCATINKYSKDANKNNSNNDVKAQAPVQVFCRIRPLQSEADFTCVRLKNSETVVLATPEQGLNAKQNAAPREMQYIFKRVFDVTVPQREIFEEIGKPLVENLIRGRNSLLFTYGVTGSGKTFTMTGDKRERGIMPRCLDALFRTISDYQAKKFVFKPDRLNGFEILSDVDAMLERSAEMNRGFYGNLPQHHYMKNSDTEIASQASCDAPVIPGLDEDNMFAVFVSYIEVYNNAVYDLLDGQDTDKALQHKIIREDYNHNMFVHGVVEVEVRSVEHALDIFHMGQKRKRMGQTILNAESSRSHSVFNIRLVQAPTDHQGEYVLHDKRTCIVSQLSLVDLAGSERLSRTKNTGVRLREAGNINNSLMTLRTCLEYLRENQQAPAGVPPKKIPYRDSKITHLFKNYFDGEGQVSMIVCINPRAEDYDENTQVLKFAEMAQEVQITRATPMKPDLGLIPGRRKANKIFKRAISNLDELGIPEAKQLPVDVDLVYSLGSDYPEFDLKSQDAPDIMQELMQYLKQRIEKRKVLSADLANRCDNFRIQLTNLEKENLSLRTELASLKCVFKQEHERNISLENKLRIHSTSLDTVNAKLAQRERQVEELTRKLNEQQYLVTQKDIEKEKQKKKFNSKLAVEVDRRDRELEIKLREQRAKLQEKMRVKDEKLRLVSNIIQSENLPNIRRTNSSEQLAQTAPTNSQHANVATNTASEVYYTPRPTRGAAVANPRHRRSRSTGEKWLEHRAPNPVPLGTILQPYLKNRKSVTKLTDMKDLTGNHATKYCLMAQEADTDGDVETKLYKGNVIPTCSGGAQVVFEDVECLKQKSPLGACTRKRQSDIAITESNVYSRDLPLTSAASSTLLNRNSYCQAVAATTATTNTDVEARCNLAIEGHKHKRSKT